ncbi:hypothetical protein [Phenylobacterium sp.]|uniref:hypothetical protein n=1 Tax=Phenylobacterium sp. TaxID=1871053 RepID=UPI0012187C4B|nr:hypothetical protein [Phenylobacterium sp.]THD64361.1 MAG: hypothetical protein E8A49_02440 [Phenylobacterium sp.]
MPMRPAGELTQVLEMLKRHTAVAPVPTEPLAMILWENIGYLIDDDRRRSLFDAFAAEIGISAPAILAADDATLLPLATRGGMRPEVRVRRWRDIAALVRDRCGGDLDGALRALPLAKARALLRAFPMIGGPGGDKILLFSGIAPTPSLESNGLRVLGRLGFFAEQPSYAASYKDALAVLATAGLRACEELVDAHQLLREHGKTLCRRGEPLCMACPLSETCPRAPVSAL